ncbi:MAG: MarR family winged helix-turn-helix transcriptional regulator [Oscillospiraceae bacterium]
MASAAKIQKIMKEIENIQFGGMFKALNETTAGIGAALRILYEQGGSATSGQLCELMGVSSARVAVLLKTMALKGLISKKKNVFDARITVVSLTPFGKETIMKMREEIYRQVNRIIDRVGFERLEEFIAIAKEIKEVVEPPKILLRDTVF